MMTSYPGQLPSAAFAQLGHHDLSLLTKVGVQFGLFGGAIARLGTTRHWDEYLDAAGSLRLPGCFAMTETGHGSNVRELETTLLYHAASHEIIVNTPNEFARKDYIGNAATHGRAAVVFGRLIVAGIDRGIPAVMVPIRDEQGVVMPGVAIEDVGDKEGLNGVDNGRLWFDDVRVPRRALLDRHASIDDAGNYSSPIENPERRFFTMIGTLVGGRIGVGAASTSVAKSALTIAVRYANRRRQFGPKGLGEWSLIDYPIHQLRLMPRLAATYAYHFAYEDLAEDFAVAGPGRDLETRAAGLKAFATWHAIDTVQAAREATGGQGYLAMNRLADMRADADVFTTYEGDNTVLAQLVAKHLLDDLKRQVAGGGRTAAARFVARGWWSRIAEAAPRLPIRGSNRRVADLEWQLAVLRRREAHTIDGLARRLRHRLRNGTDSFGAFAEVQAHALTAARAHVDRLTFEATTRAAAETDDAGLTVVLHKLAGLHGAALIENDLDWYLEHGVLSARSAANIRRLVSRLSAALASESVALVDAFAIPDEVLDAPIGLEPNRSETTS